METPTDAGVKATDAGRRWWLLAMSRKKRGRKGKPRRPQGRERHYSPLEHHERRGKQFVPPMMQLENVKFSHWMNERLPDLLWAVLLIGQAPRDVALDYFREVARLGREIPEEEKRVGVTHSRLALWPAEVRAAMLRFLTKAPTARQALRPLLLFDDLPLREEWEAAVRGAPVAEDWERLSECVGPVLFHQSDGATDCRWLRVLFLLVRGQIVVPTTMVHLAEEVLHYPDRGDLRAVQPTIRAMEGGLDVLEEGEPPPTWPAAFWSQCLRDTPCLSAELLDAGVPAVGTTRNRVAEVQRAIFNHCLATQATTAVDAKHDSAFGLATFAVTILTELLGIGASASVAARGALRTLLEARVTLRYLRQRDDEAIWSAYRAYGAGQAKLAFQHLDRLEQDVVFVDRAALEELANEDMWLEYRTVNVGHWDSSNLRQLAEDAGLKDLYDTYYPWTSAFVHAHWGAVRDATFETCRNPLHRLHRIPRQSARVLGDVLSDAVTLVDGILEDLAALFPMFELRLRVAA